jgi:hypothetical protein
MVPVTVLELPVCQMPALPEMVSLPEVRPAG